MRNTNRWGQVRAKAVLLRDLQELRAKRFALENPTKAIKEEASEPNTAEGGRLQGAVAAEGDLQSSPEPEIKQEKVEPTDSELVTQGDDKRAAEVIEDPSKEATAKLLEETKAQQGPSPPSSANGVDTSSNPIGLGINTTGTTTDPAPTTAEIRSASVDSLFDVPDDEDDNGDSALNFENMDFSFQDSTGNTQHQDQSQPQNNEFDLSAFENTSPDFNIPDLHASNDTNLGNNANKIAGSNQADSLFGTGDNSGSGDNMDLDLDLSMTEGMDSVFDDDMFFGSGDTDMKHGEFDDAFFGIDNH